ncbi:MAG: hypothetical protein ABI461_08020 [Polyangiaceae bacterium]
MRRHGAVGASGLAFLLSVALSVGAIAQQAAPTSSASKAGAAKAPASSTAAATSAKPAASGASSAAASAASATSASASATAATSAGAPTTATPTASAAPANSAGMDGATYAVRLRDLEGRVDELKDQIRRSHTRLALLSDTIMGGGAAGSRSEITFDNQMSSAFKLTRAVIVLDGAVQYNRQDDSGALADQKEIPVFNGSVPPGDHTVSILLNFQGNGYGVFTYLRGYKFEVKSSHSFTATEGKTIAVIATALEKGGVTTPLEQRPSVQWNEKIQSLGGTGSAPVAAPAPAGNSGSSGGASGNVSVGGGSK